MTKGLDRYLQDAEQLHANYFDDTVGPMNTSPMSDTGKQVKQTTQNNLPTAKPESIDKVELAKSIPGSLKTDTGHLLQWQTIPKSTSQQGIDQDANLQCDQLQDEDKQDTIIHNADALHNDDDHTASDTIADGTTIQLEKPITELFPTDDVTIPNKKVGCVFVTRHLQQFLEGYLPPSDKQAFLDIITTRQVSV